MCVETGRTIAMNLDDLFALLDPFLDQLLPEISPTSPEEMEQILNEVLASTGIGYVEAPLDVARFRLNLNRESDRGCALMAAAYLDTALMELLQRFFVDDQKASKHILDGTGVLSSFAARIELAYLIGLISPKLREDLNRIRRIRNEFAHTSSEVRFDDPEIAKLCNDLYHHPLVNQLPRSPRAKFITVSMSVLGAIHATTRTTEHRPKKKNLDLSQPKVVERIQELIAAVDEALKKRLASKRNIEAS